MSKMWAIEKCRSMMWLLVFALFFACSVHAHDVEDEDEDDMYVMAMLGLGMDHSLTCHMMASPFAPFPSLC